MPYALFTDGDGKISKAFETRDDVWKHADEAGLVVDVTSDQEKPIPKRVLDKDYEIRPCEADEGDERPVIRREGRAA
jgi:hypothetical protein